MFIPDQGRYLIEVETNKLNNVKKILDDNNVYNEVVGTVQKDYFEIPGEFKITSNDLYKINNSWYSNY